MNKIPPGHVPAYKGFFDAIRKEANEMPKPPREKRIAKIRGVPERRTKTGRVYFYAVEHRDKETNLVDLSPLLKDLSSLDIQRKIWVLKEKHQMTFVKPEDAPPWVYEVHPLGNPATRDGLRASDRLVKTVLTRQAKAFSTLYVEDGEANLEAWVEDTFLMLTNELRWGAK